MQVRPYNYTKNTPQKKLKISNKNIHSIPFRVPITYKKHWRISNKE
jgi:hypothetical protein